MISRRRFLGMLTLGIAGVLCSFRLFRATRKSHVIVHAIGKHLNYLKVSESEVLRFADDYKVSLEGKDARGLYWLSVIYPLVEILPARSMGVFRERVALIEESICQSFLLSSDFDFSLEGTARSVSYRTLYDPYRGACMNPFARFD